jgi:hypothetical protein
MNSDVYLVICMSEGHENVHQYPMSQALFMHFILISCTYFVPFEIYGWILYMFIGLAMGSWDL